MFSGFIEGLRSLVFGSPFPGKERREMARLRCYYGVTCYDAEDRGHGARVTEMSLTGMRLEGATGFKRGAHIYISLPKAHSKKKSIRCTVVWTQRRPTGTWWVGVVYDDSQKNVRASWARDVLRELGFDEKNIYQRRQHVRFPSALEGEVRDGRGDLLTQVAVLNLGVGGALVRTDRSIPENSMLRLIVGPYGPLPSMELPGMMIRSREDPEVQGERLCNFRLLKADDGTIKQLGRYLVLLLREGSV